jgi:hypothetical protein
MILLCSSNRTCTQSRARLLAVRIERHCRVRCNEVMAKAGWVAQGAGRPNNRVGQPKQASMALGGQHSTEFRADPMAVHSGYGTIMARSEGNLKDCVTHPILHIRISCCTEHFTVPGVSRLRPARGTQMLTSQIDVKPEVSAVHLI